MLYNNYLLLQSKDTDDWKPNAYTIGNQLDIKNKQAQAWFGEEQKKR